MLQSTPGVITQNLGASNALSFMWFNLSSAKIGDQTSYNWFSSTDFRLAICSAVDRAAIVTNVYQGLATEAQSLLSPANPVWFSPEIITCQYNPQFSRSLLKKAGFSWEREDDREALFDSSGREVTFELLTRSDDVFGKVAAIVQQDLSELGIKLLIRQEEFRAVISRVMGSRDYESALLKLDIPIDPTAMSAVLLSSGPMHMWDPGQSEPATQWEADIDRWMNLQAITPVQKERQEIFKQIQETLADQIPLVPLVHQNVIAAWHEKLIGVRPAPIFPYTLWNIWEISYKKEPAS